MQTNPTAIIEALLFAAEAPLGTSQLAKAAELNPQQVREAIAELKAHYEATHRAFELVEVGGGWRLRTKAEFGFWVRRLRRQQLMRLSRAALETLAIVAYKQPVMRSEIERIRGVDCGGVLKLLMEKGLIRVAGRKDLPGRPLVYATTRRFLEVFDLKSLKELPTLAEAKQMLEGQQELFRGEGPQT